MAKPKPRAYSYLRFSTSEQLKGDSLRRQSEAAQAYADRYGLELDQELTFRDLGVSAYRGANVEKALGAFLEAVDSGRVKPGSCLLVENLDRLSRADIRTARDRFESILDRGIHIVTLTNGKTYSAEGYDLADMLLTLMDMSRAHEESALKSERLRAAWQEKKRKAADGQLLTSETPGWIRVRDGKLEVIEKRAAVVRKIFDMARKGHGKAYIARQLNLEGVKPFNKSNGWHDSYIARILSNPAVIGVYQPRRYEYQEGRRVRVNDGEPVEGYFPQVVEPGIFYSIKHGPARASGKRDNPIRNLLSGLACCGRCGGPLHFVDKGKPPKGNQYLACDNRRRFKSCDAPSVRYDATLREVLAQVRDFKPLEDGSEGARRDKELAALAGQIEEKAEAVERMLDLVEAGQLKGSRAVERLDKLEAELEELKAKRRELEEKEVARHGSHLPPGVVYETIEDASPWVLADNPTGREDLAAFVKSELARMVERVEVEKGQPIKVTPKTGLTFEEKEPAVELVGRRTKPVKVIPRSDG